MKIRHGFVSNSSTTSFCIYGVGFESDTKAVEGIDVTDLEFKYCDPKESSAFDLLDELGSVLGKGWEVIFTPYDYVYIGKSLSSMTDEDSFGVWKQEIKDVFTKLYPDRKLGFSVCEDGWYDG